MNTADGHHPNYDTVIVGARCAGAALAIELARAGQRVLLVDRDEFPSDTLSTHCLWPHVQARLDALGALARLRVARELNPQELRWRGFGHEFSGAFTPCEGFDLAILPRRIALDAVLLETALAAGAQARLGTSVTGLLGSGSEGDPVRGVRTADGESMRAGWVVGADGRGSKVAGTLGLAKARVMHADTAMIVRLLAGTAGHAGAPVRRPIAWRADVGALRGQPPRKRGLPRDARSWPPSSRGP